MSVPTILIVDDTQQIRKLVQKVVSHVFPDCNVIGVDSGFEALNFFDEQTPALIISDIQMPDIDGYELMRQIYIDRGNSDIPFMFISAWASHGDDCQIRYELEDRGLPIVPIASKPINIVDLKSKITQMLQKSSVAM